MRSLGLHKALNEYYKVRHILATLSASSRACLRVLCSKAAGRATQPHRARTCMRRAHPPQMTSSKPCILGRPRKAAGPSMLYTLLCATALRPVPCFLTPEVLSATAGWAAYILALVLYHTAPITLPLALWLALSSATGGAQLQLPAATIHALPALGALRVPHGALPLRAVLAGVLLFLAALRVAERAVQRAASRRAACAARALRPEQVEAYYAGWELPESVVPGQAGRAAEERDDVLQVRGRERWGRCVR